MDSKLLQIVTMVWVSLAGVLSSPKGAPQSTCMSMAPSISAHGAGPMTEESPYKVTIKGGLSYTPGQTFTISIEKIDPTTKSIRGFFVQARKLESGNAIPQGTFAEVSNGKLMKCDKQDDSITHNDISLKPTVIAKWTAPSDPVGDVKFYATIAQEQDIYWVKVESQILQLASATGPMEPPSSTNSTTTQKPKNRSDKITSVKFCLILAAAVGILQQFY